MRFRLNLGQTGGALWENLCFFFQIWILFCTERRTSRNLVCWIILPVELTGKLQGKFCCYQRKKKTASFSISAASRSEILKMKDRKTAFILLNLAHAPVSSDEFMRMTFISLSKVNGTLWDKRQIGIIYVALASAHHDSTGKRRIFTKQNLSQSPSRFL